MSMIDEQSVIDFLQANPSFFIRNEALLSQLHLPHLRDAGASSFLQHQLKQVKNQRSDLMERLKNLMSRAEQNAQLLNQLNALVITLLATPKTERAQVLGEQTKRLFNIDQFVLMAMEPDAAEQQWQSQSLVRFSAERPNACEVNAEQSQLLFQVEGLRSVCAIPLGELGERGVILLGSSDSTRFVSQLDTSLLEQYAQIALAALALN